MVYAFLVLRLCVFDDVVVHVLYHFFPCAVRRLSRFRLMMDNVLSPVLSVIVGFLGLFRLKIAARGMFCFRLWIGSFSRRMAGFAFWYASLCFVVGFQESLRR